MKIFILFLCLMAQFSTSHGQTIQKGKAKSLDKSFAYFYLKPQEEIKGILLLIPAWGEKPKSVFYKNKLPYLLLEKGFVTIIPELTPSFTPEPNTFVQLDVLIRTFQNTSSTKHIPCVLGGLSIGGTIALHYAEYLASQQSSSKVDAIFTIDPPLDLTRLYISSVRKIEYACSSNLIKKEGLSIKKNLEDKLEGSANEQQEAYIHNSVFSANQADGGNAKLLFNIPIRLYAEPDLAFVQKTYCEALQFEDINAVDSEKLQQLLQRLGNKHVEYIATKNRGFHSWNILEPHDFIKWITPILPSN